MSAMTISASQSQCKRLAAAFICLVAFMVSAAPQSLAQDATCKAVADAQTLLMRTPHHTFSTDMHGGRTTAVEDIMTPNGTFWETGGVWHRSRRSMKDLADAKAEALKGLRNCRRGADELVSGTLTSQYSLHNEESGGDESVWIGKSNGLVLKSEVRIEDRKISSRYEYGNIQPPANVH